MCVCQAFARVVAHWFTGVDLWLTPTLSTPPALIGQITSPPQQPLRALEIGGKTVAYAGVVANMTHHWSRPTPGSSHAGRTTPT